MPPNMSVNQSCVFPVDFWRNSNFLKIFIFQLFLLNTVNEHPIFPVDLLSKFKFFEKL